MKILMTVLSFSFLLILARCGNDRDSQNDIPRGYGYYECSGLSNGYGYGYGNPSGYGGSAYGYGYGSSHYDMTRCNEFSGYNGYRGYRRGYDYNNGSYTNPNYRGRYY